MTIANDRILDDALSLSTDVRIDLVEKLLRSLNPPIDEDIDRIWTQEVERRIAQIEDGEVELVPGEEVFAKLFKIQSLVRLRNKIRDFASDDAKSRSRVYATAVRSILTSGATDKRRAPRFKLGGLLLFHGQHPLGHGQAVGHLVVFHLRGHRLERSRGFRFAGGIFPGTRRRPRNGRRIPARPSAKARH